MRNHSRELVVDTGLFNAHQMQPRELLRHQMQGCFGWLEAHAASYPKLVEKHGFGFVYMAIDVRYHDSVSFPDYEKLRYETSIRLMRRGTRLDVAVRFFGEDRLLADVSTLLGIVKIEESVATSARPDALSESIQSCFDDDEKSDESPKRKMPDLVASIEANGPAMHTQKMPFTISRNQCEFADQWVFYQIPTIYEPARENLAVEHGRNVPALKRGLRNSLCSVTMELNRPFYAFDRGYIETNVYDEDNRVIFLHRLYSEMPGNPVHATIVEQF